MPFSLSSWDVDGDSVTSQQWLGVEGTTEKWQGEVTAMCFTTSTDLSKQKPYVNIGRDGVDRNLTSHLQNADVDELRLPPHPCHTFGVASLLTSGCGSEIQNGLKATQRGRGEFAVENV